MEAERRCPSKVLDGSAVATRDAKHESGSSDTFRIKIWNGTDENDMVYDNVVQQEVGGGSVVIHRK